MMKLDKQFEPTSNTAIHLNGLRLLLVDDDLDTRVLFTFILEDYGAEVIGVASVQDALEAIGQFQPHLLVSDINLPDKDGYSLIREVRGLEAEQERQIPAIAISGVYPGGANCSNTSSTDFQLYLTKPVDPDQLVKAVVDLAKRESLASPETPRTLHKVQ
jgi:CheY-like chemotaxis protein